MDLEAQNLKNRPKSENRIRYEAAVEVIRRRYGGLEEMRAKLGFSQKQMSEMLLVDPSAWTRWVKGGESPPAHIYQALAWYFEAREARSAHAVTPADPIEKIQWKMPDQSMAPDEAAAASVVTAAILPASWEIEKAILIDELRETQKKAVGVSDGWKLFLLLNSLGLAYVILSSFLGGY